MGRKAAVTVGEELNHASGLAVGTHPQDIGFILPFHAGRTA
jgi:hypothetical protein